MRHFKKLSWFAHSFLSRLCRVAIILVALTRSSLAFCGEIHDAAKDGDLTTITRMVKGNPGLIFAKDTGGATPLHWAALKDRIDVAAFLITSKAEVNAKDNAGWTPLHFAAVKGYKNMVELLLKDKADVNAKDNVGDTPLLLAALFGDKDVVESLLANKAEVNAKDNKGETPLHFALKMNHKAVVTLLRQHGGHE